MFENKKSFFEKLTGSLNPNSEHEPGEREMEAGASTNRKEREKEASDWMEEDNGEGQLTVDVYQTPEDIIIQTMVAGVKPEDLNISINRDMVTIKGRREGSRSAKDDNYFFKELYWGAFSRTILLPQEIDVDASEALEKHGLLTIRLPKLNKEKTTKIRVKSL
ncbi:MAG: Hsp20/alpha crystallin family protein [Candidatus Lloydbacteria bacterium]|nr:Hsp20/alpha crystallin family protein [Candidatus Lloydbacteria bacterium]